MQAYTPAPIKTEKIQFAAAQERLIIDLTENPNDIWATKRIADGWSGNEKRDDEKKQHPCLVPFSELPDSEKAYDRKIVEQTIKAALALGYQITKP